MNQVRSWVFNSNVWWAVTLGAVAAAGLGCEPSNTVKPGAAVMLSFGAVYQPAPTDSVDGPAYLTTVDAAGVPLIPPRSEFIAIFDRLLDPSLLEDPTTSTGLPGLATLTTTVPSVTLDASTVYAPGGDATFHVLLAAGPSFTVVPSCGLPAGAPGGVQLTMADFVSGDGRDLGDHVSDRAAGGRHRRSRPHRGPGWRPGRARHGDAGHHHHALVQ